VESALKKAEADYAHFNTILEMCNTLLHKYKFSISAITQVYEAAKKCGEPIEVIKAI